MYLFLFGGERRCIAENKGEKQEDGGEKKKKKKGKEEKKGAVSAEQAEHPP